MTGVQTCALPISLLTIFPLLLTLNYMVSKITDKVIDTATEWQNRMLDKIYPIVYLDAMYFKVRSNRKIVNTAVYICLGYTMEGYKDILGLWVD